MANDSFQKLDVDPIQGTSLLHAMDIHPEEYEHENIKFMKVLEVIEFFKDFSNATDVISRVTRGMDREKKLDKIHGFVQLHKKRNEVREELQALENEIDQYEAV